MTGSSNGMKHKFAVTGGTGFVGGHLIRMARAAGHEVRALARSWKPPEDGVEWIEGALDRPETLVRLCAGTDAVIHIAGLINGADRASFEAVNATGTANMIAASGLEWTILRPPAVYGPGDRETFELFKMARRGIVALPPAGRFSIIHVEDLCRLILALPDQPDTIAHSYEPDDGEEQGWEHRQFARTLAGAFGRRAATLAMPRPVLRAASGMERLFRRGKAKLTADRVRYFCHPDWVAAADARPPSLLWKPQIRTEAGLEQTARWYEQAGWFKHGPS
jgi:nucleoside-diphosphate-sugar epimerase